MKVGFLAFLEYVKTYVFREKVFGGVDSQLREQYLKDVLYWKQILHRVSPVKLLAPTTTGTSWDSWIFYSRLMLQHVEDETLAELKASKYYSISVNSSADITHCDQLALILCIDSKSGNPVERFIIRLTLKTAERFDKVSKGLQNITTNLNDIVLLYTLNRYREGLQDRFNFYKFEGKKITLM
ncbi:hypothetical protein PR048_009864 [Dryococelus australis]|uniref:Uncharacterized protein n=1 Tax=Dryococelus australis TaxID=614101 RepID=A0ABQ9I140_9NEOP|nr:hypothetical protein PR048_009864 [Dryococelus australis]